METSRFHAGPVSCVDVRADGTLVSGGYDAALLLWSATGSPLRRYAGHRALVNAVRFSPDETRIASASSDHTARVFDVESGACLAILEGHRDDVNGVAWSPDGTRVATASFDGTARVHDAATGALLAICAGHAADVNGIAWSPDARVLATASDDGTVRLFDPNGAPKGVLRGHSSWVDAVAFSPDGKMLASASLDRSVRVWDVASGVCVATLADHGCTVKAVAWSPDGTRLATAAYDKRLRVFARDGWSEIASVRDTQMWNRSLAWSRCGTLATGSFGGAPVRWRLGDSQACSADSLGTPGINSLALSPDGRFAATACDDGGARLVEVATGRILQEYFDHEGAVLSAAWSSTGALVAFGGWDDRVVIRDVSRPSIPIWIEGHGEPVNALAFSRNAETLALGGFMGTVSVWDAATGASRGIAGAHDGSVKSVAALPHGGWISTGRDGFLRVLLSEFDAHRGRRAIQVGPTIVNGVAVDPAGCRSACVSRSHGVEVFDVDTGRRLYSYREHPCSARTVAFSHDGSSVAAGYYDGHLLLWQLEDRKPRLLRPFGPVPLSAVAFTPCDQSVVVATWDPSGRHGTVGFASGQIETEHSLAQGSRWR